jgi:hypothetical protein
MRNGSPHAGGALALQIAREAAKNHGPYHRPKRQRHDETGGANGKAHRLHDLGQPQLHAVGGAVLAEGDQPKQPYA